MKIYIIRKMLLWTKEPLVINRTDKNAFVHSTQRHGKVIKSFDAFDATCETFCLGSKRTGKLQQLPSLQRQLNLLRRHLTSWILMTSLWVGWNHHVALLPRLSGSHFLFLQDVQQTTDGHLSNGLCNPPGRPWAVGICFLLSTSTHPRQPHEFCCRLSCGEEPYHAESTKLESLGDWGIRVQLYKPWDWVCMLCWQSCQATLDFLAQP